MVRCSSLGNIQLRSRFERFSYGSCVPLISSALPPGKVVYGEKKSSLGPAYEGHRSLLAPTLATLTELETQAQHIFLRCAKLLLASSPPPLFHP